ncbi:MAG: transcription-repair coupling factor [Deltaproteobacteria bacterium]|nr:MAG: transcription-repair coupling factor [Deltaproteobacteria bacterium]
MSAHDPSPEDLRRRLDDERALAAIRYPLQELLQQLERSGRASLTGAGGAWLGLVLTDLALALDRPLVIVTPGNRQARALAAALRALGADGDRRTSHWLPAPDVSPYAGASPDRAIAMARLDATRAAASLHNGDALVTSAAGWARRIVPAPTLDQHSITLAVEEELDVDHLQTLLVAGGYSPVGLVEDPGTFSIRGGLVDLYAPGWDRPVRIDLYGDLIESIRAFDPGDQRSGDALETVRLGPVREEVLTPDTLETARRRLVEQGSALRIPSNRIQALLHDLESGQRFFNIESLLPAFHDTLEPLASRIPGTSAVVFVEPEAIDEEIERLHDARTVEFQRECEAGELAFPPEEFFLRPEVARSLAKDTLQVDVRSLDTGETPAEVPPIDFPALDNAELVRIRKQHGEGAAHGPIAETLDRWREWYGRIVCLCGSRGAATRLVSLLVQHGIEAGLEEEALDPAERRDTPCARIEVRIGELEEGFRSPSRGLAVVTDREVFGRASRRGGAEMFQEAASIASFRELLVGDLVVHIDHGVARYSGLERMDVGGYENDFLSLEYAGGDRLFLPVHRLDRVQRYVGSPSFSSLDRLGGTGWERTQERVRRQLADVAEELIRIQAERAAREGRAFSAPDDVFRAFEAAFPHEETPHQAQAIEEILADMQSARPMDRLLCGDVGFGKTEVAMRAACKAVVDGAQVAVLVPTTVLAEQHLKSFRERFSGFPVRVESLSRFRSTREMRQIVDDTAAGKVDILIGTHRLLSEDVRYRDLGLLIIDEEQRFGVTHKERIKTLRASIDVLTMTATPIPRTLEMSLLGVRDMSVIMTPPPGRLAVRTHLARFRENIIREAMTSEFERGGQVFFVHNRVDSIHAVAEELQRMVPQARIAIGHAQLSDTELEKVMLRFLSREANVLLSTTIIESGIDIATANTIFINRADTFGLAQLHQLRGRVGRGSDRGFCYLLVNEPRTLNDDARRRLEVLQQHTELGAGLQIAQQDLDIRGAGNLLGRDQSGHIESIGFELYAELLQDAIADLRGEPVDREPEPEVKLPVTAYIPEDYVEDVGQRLAFYKRFSAASDDGTLHDLFAELEDRYGPAPEPARVLRDIVTLKILLRQIRATRIEAGPKAIVLELPPQTRLDPDRVIELITASAGQWEFRPEMKLIRHLKGHESTAIVATALEAGRALLRCRSNG